MRALVVVAHPDESSFTHAIATTTINALKANGHEVTLCDLYAEGFSAAMTAVERVAYESDTPVVSPQVADYVAAVTATELLIFVYPTWWSSLPAIMKGWLDRVLVPGVAFGFNDNGKLRPRLTNVRRVVGISTYGSAWPYIKFINDNGRRTIGRTLRLSTGPRTRMTWLAMYRMDTATDARRNAFLERVTASVGSW